MPQPTAPADPSPRLIRLVADVPCERIDLFLPSRLPGVSRSQAARMIREGAVTLNGRHSKAAHPVLPGDAIVVILPEPAIEPQAEAIEVRVVYADDDIIVIDKPAGLVVHPAPGHPEHTLVNALLHRYPDLTCGDSLRPGIVHRLDKDTSGLMVVARNERTRLWLVSQFKQGLVHKEYAALVTGSVETEGSISGPIGRHPTQRQRMTVTAAGKPARTDYRVREALREYSYVTAMPRTGRTHQIRVHFASIGHPVAGDSVYGGRVASKQLRPWLTRHFLHAESLTFALPGRNEPLRFTSPLPPDLRRALVAAQAR